MLAAVAGGGVWLGTVVTHAQGSPPPQPGSPQDPLVSVSYVAQALTRAGAHILRLRAGEAWQPAVGTAWALVGGDATINLTAPPPSTSAPVSSSPPVPALPAVVDLTAGKPLPVTAAPAALPANHLLVVPASGASVTAGSEGAVLWVAASGAGRTRPGAASLGS